MTLPEKVRIAIETHGLLTAGDTVLVACSGGADSVALLAALAELRADMGFAVRAAHVNHRLRGEESDADQEFVRELCGALDVELDSVSLDRKRFDGQGNLEDEARRARYDELAGLAAPFDARVATGHTLDDQAETFLMKLFRGAGPGGLSGIAVRRLHRNRERGFSVTVIRPLLDVHRGEIHEYLHERRIDYRTDRTNRDTRFDRNWVRHELIPVIERRLNPRLAEVLSRTSKLFQELDAFLDEEVVRRLRFDLSDPAEVRLPIEALRNLPRPLRKAAVRSAYRSVRGTLSDLTLRHVDSVLALLERSSGRRIDLPGDVVAQKEFDLLRIGAPPQELAFGYRLDWPAEQAIAEVAKRVRLLRLDPAAGETGDLILPVGPLTIRNRRPGDRYRISPRSPEKSLKRIFIERRIPVSVRTRLLIVESEGGIVWVEGLPPAPPARAPDAGEGLCRILVETFERT